MVGFVAKRARSGIGRALALLMIGVIGFGPVAPAQASGFATIYNFTGGADGGAPFGVILDRSGTLYGTTYRGGGADLGTIYALSPSGTAGQPWLKTTLYSFAGGADGAHPYGRLRQDNAGHLYSAARDGGSFGFGALFELRRLVKPVPGWQPWPLYSFSGGIDGGNPVAGLIEDRTGHFFGTTTYGGALDRGAVFEVYHPPNRHDWVGATLFDFPTGIAGAPTAGLVQAPNGTLYGTAGYYGASGTGAVFALSPAAPGSSVWNAATLYQFGGGRDGGNPLGGLVRDVAGALYGTTFRGGRYGAGTVFRLGPPTDPSQSQWVRTTLYDFTGTTDGGNPRTGLALDGQGNLYGTTAYGGTGGAGTVFKLSAPDSTGLRTPSILYDFTGGADGGAPQADLIVDAAGRLFGTTTTGGTGAGTVFEITP